MVSVSCDDHGGATGGIIFYSPLVLIVGHRVQLTLVFSCLVGNTLLSLEPLKLVQSPVYGIEECIGKVNLFILTHFGSCSLVTENSIAHNVHTKVDRKIHISLFVHVDTTFGDQGEGSAGVCVSEKTTETSTEGSDQVGNTKKKGMKQTALT